MLTQTLWWSCTALMAFLLVRAISGRFFRKYLIFYIYVGNGVLLTLARFYVYIFKTPAYRTFWWYTEFLSIAAGYCVIWEIYQQALAAYPGTIRMASCLIWAFFILVMGNTLGSALSDPDWALAKTVGELERNLRVVQAVMLVIVLAILTYYVIPIGRNLRGIILGYGFFIAMGVINNTLRSRVGDTFQMWWRYTQSISWLITLLIWSATLWSYHPNPAPEADIEIERDYDLLYSRTTHAMAKARGYFLKAVKS